MKKLLLLSALSLLALTACGGNTPSSSSSKASSSSAQSESISSEKSSSSEASSSSEKQKRKTLTSYVTKTGKTVEKLSEKEKVELEYDDNYLIKNRLVYEDANTKPTHKYLGFTWDEKGIGTCTYEKYSTNFYLMASGEHKESMEGIEPTYWYTKAEPVEGSTESVYEIDEVIEEYDGDVLVSSTHHYLEGNEYRYKTTYEYDAKGRVSVATLSSLVNDDEKYTNVQKDEFQYEGDSLLPKEKAFSNWNGSTFDLVEYTTYTYNEKGELIQESLLNKFRNIQHTTTYELVGNVYTKTRKNTKDELLELESWTYLEDLSDWTEHHFHSYEGNEEFNNDKQEFDAEGDLVEYFKEEGYINTKGETKITGYTQINYNYELI